MTSAIHYKGQKLYELAHQGIEVEREARHVCIKSLDLLDFKDNVIKFRTTVSKGTYIRTLGENIAEKYLREKGYVIIDRNWRTRNGEIDIISYKRQFISLGISWQYPFFIVSII